MKLVTRISVCLTLLTGLTVGILLTGSILGVLDVLKGRTAHNIAAVAALIDSRLAMFPPQQLSPWVDDLMMQFDVIDIKIMTKRSTLFAYHNPLFDNGSEDIAHLSSQTFDLPNLPGALLEITHKTITLRDLRSWSGVLPLMVGMVLILLVLTATIYLLNKSLSSLVRLDKRAENIIRGEREEGSTENNAPSPFRVDEAFDTLLADLKVVNAQRSRLDTLIRRYAAQDGTTGVHHRQFFENQLATLLEEPRQADVHGIVMIIRLPDFDMLYDSWGAEPVNAFRLALLNMLSGFFLPYPGAILAHYLLSDFVVLLPHRTLKEADMLANQVLNALDTLPPTRMVDRDNMLHIGICAWRNGQTKDQVMDHAECAIRNAVLQASNNWSVYDENVPQQGRGSVRWRTLLENALSGHNACLRFYQKPSVDRQGRVLHREIMCRIDDGGQEILSAEYLPMISQFGLSERYDRIVIHRLLSLAALWPEEHFAVQFSVSSLLRPSFRYWIRDTLMQCEKSQRKRIIFELAEADVCQYISQLRQILRLISGFGIRLAIAQAGGTVVSSSYINDLDIDLIKLHPGLVRNIGKRTENILLVQSLVEVCNGTHTPVLASGVRTRSEWQTLMDNGVAGAQGDFIAPSQIVDSAVKKYSQRYSV